MLDVNVCVGACLYYCCCCNRILDAAGLLTRPSLRSVLGLVEQVRTNQSIYARSQTRHERQRMLNTTNALDGQGRPETEGHYLPSERSAHAEEQRASAVMNETV